MDKKTLSRDNDGRRSGKNDRRILLNPEYSSDRRSSEDRRSGFNRRCKN